LVLEAIELTNKIMLSYGYRDPESLDDESAFFIDFAKSIIHTFINNLTQPNSIFKTYSILSITESKATINQFFEYFKKLGSADYQFLFEKIF
jgi:hypothetical protein